MSPRSLSASPSSLPSPSKSVLRLQWTCRLCNPARHGPLATVSAQSHTQGKGNREPCPCWTWMEGEGRPRPGVTPWLFTSEHEALTLPSAAVRPQGLGGLGFGNQGAMNLSPPDRIGWAGGRAIRACMQCLPCGGCGACRCSAKAGRAVDVGIKWLGSSGVLYSNAPA
jgi:hypothetical protein